MSPSKKEVRLTVRIPVEVAAQIRALKNRDRRSLNAQLVVLLERGLRVKETVALAPAA